MLSFRRIVRIAGAIIGIALIHSAFIGGQSRLGFLGVMMLALLGLLGGPLLLRMAFLAIGAAAVLGAGVAGSSDASPFILLAAPLFANVAVMLLFGVTLLPGRVPLITRFSRFDNKQSQGHAIDRHTRILTVLWAGYFALVVGATLASMGAGKFLAASWIITVVSPLGSVAFFLLEHLYRFLRKDVFGEASVARTLRILMQPDAWRGSTRDV